MPYHNIQQCSDALDTLVAQGQKTQTDLAATFLAEVSPLAARVAALETQVKELQAGLAAAVGTPTAAKT